MEKPALNDYPILEPLRQRWSPLAFSPTPVAKETLLSLFEAARWAPSCFNDQPWRFVVGTRADDPATYDKILGTLVEANAAWAQNAPVLILAVAAGSFRHKRQAEPLGRVRSRAGGRAPDGSSVGARPGDAPDGRLRPGKGRAPSFALPEDHDPLAVIAVGFPGKTEDLPTDALRTRESNPERSRIPLGQMVLSGAESWGRTSPLV